MSGSSVWLQCLTLVSGSSFSHQCLVSVFGTSAWLQCLTLVSDNSVLFQCLTPVTGTSVWLQCLALVSDTSVWLQCMAPVFHILGTHTCIWYRTQSLKVELDIKMHGYFIRLIRNSFLHPHLNEEFSFRQIFTLK